MWRSLFLFFLSFILIIALILLHLWGCKLLSIKTEGMKEVMMMKKRRNSRCVYGRLLI